MIINHENRAYRRKYGLADYEPERELSEQICELIPKVKTDRDWFTVNIKQATDGAVVVVHSVAGYDWLEHYKDLILICPNKGIAKAVRKFGRAVVLDEITAETLQAAIPARETENPEP